MKRYENPETEKEMLDKIMTEHELFMYRTLSGTAHEIYDSCKRICFYESLNEYFLYNEQISKEFVNVSARSSRIIKELWDIYLKYEYLRVDTWEEIDCLLQIYVEEHNKDSEKLAQ